MTISEVVTVSDARSQLSQLLAALSEAGPEAEPILIGPHRRPQGVLLSVAAYEALVRRQSRGDAIASASGSLAAEGLVASRDADRDAAEYIRGDIGAEEMTARAVSRYTAGGEGRAG